MRPRVELSPKEKCADCLMQSVDPFDVTGLVHQLMKALISVILAVVKHGIPALPEKIDLTTISHDYRHSRIVDGFFFPAVQHGNKASVPQFQMKASMRPIWFPMAQLRQKEATVPRCVQKIAMQR